MVSSDGWPLKVLLLHASLLLRVWQHCLQHAPAAQVHHVSWLGCWCALPHAPCGAALARLQPHAYVQRHVCDMAGPLLLIIFAVITYYYSLMLVDAYRYPTVDGPTRNYTYIEAVRRYLGARLARRCSIRWPGVAALRDLQGAR